MHEKLLIGVVQQLSVSGEGMTLVSGRSPPPRTHIIIYITNILICCKVKLGPAQCSINSVDHHVIKTQHPSTPSLLNNSAPGGRRVVRGEGEKREKKGSRDKLLIHHVFLRYDLGSEVLVGAEPQFGGIFMLLSTAAGWRSVLPAPRSPPPP